MTGLIGSSNAISTGFAWIFIHLFDNVAYGLLATAYAIFRAVSKLDIFGTESVNKLFTGITNRVYNVIFIVAVFIVSYQVLMYIVNPDKNKDKLNQGTGRLVWNIMLSVILVIMCPLLFRYMAIFQEHVLSEGTVFSLVSGTGAAPDTNWQGKGFALVMYMSVLHPAGADYSTFFDTSKDDIVLKSADVAKPACKSQCQDEGFDETPCQNVCADYYSNLEKIMDSIDTSKSVVWTLSDGMSHLIDDGVAEYSWIIATVVGIVTAWFFISYALDLGVRAVKLGFLQLIAPVPILMKPFTKPGGSFDKWFKELTKTYLELFVRLATIALSIEIIKAIPALFDALLKADDNITTMSKPIAFVILVLGVLKFAKEAPDLLKNIFSGGGNWLSGLDLKPGVKRRVENNTYAMKGLSAGAGMLSGARAGMQKAFHDSKVDGGSTKANVMHAASGFLRGARTGMVSGFKNSSTTLKGMGDVVDSTRNTAHIAQQKHQDQVATHKSLIQQAYSDSGLDANAGIYKKFKAIAAGQAKHGMKVASDAIENAKEGIKTYNGENGVINQAKIENLNAAYKLSTSMDDVLNTKLKVFDDGIAKDRDAMRAAIANNKPQYVLEYDEHGNPKKDEHGNTVYREITPPIKYKGYTYDASRGEWFKTGTDINFNDDVKARRAQEAGKINYSEANFKTFKEMAASMEKMLKNSSLSADDYEELAKKLNGALGLKNTDAAAFHASDLNSDEFAKKIIARASNPDETLNQQQMGAMLSGLQAIGKGAKDLATLESATALSQQKAEESKKDNK